MARKAKQEPAKLKPTSESLRAASSRPQEPKTASARARIWLFSKSTTKAFCLVLLASIYAPLSQLILAPVYGAIPSSIYHNYGLIGSSLLAFSLRGILPKWVERGLPAFVFWIPSLQLTLFNFSSALGNPLGPLVTEIITLFPLITWSLYVANKTLENMDLSFLGSTPVQEAAPSMVLYMLFTVLERLFRGALPLFTGFGYLTSRVGMQIVIGTLYGMILPRSLFWPAIPSIAITMTMNVHNPLQRTTTVLNNTLALDNYAILDRRESLTGYLSVVEDRNRGFRVLRCDHSILGGQWLDPPEKDPHRRVAEPIYAVFTMLEAVRLVEPASNKADTGAKTALNIGLGIGTAPSALIAHGINTTIVEIDPVVHYFAGKYFSLPKNHSYVIGDAVPFVESRAATATEPTRYDYIIHDSFTGGAVPTSLFTHEFLTSLSTLLKSDGTIAINYAGDLNGPAASMMHRTISAVFPNCRAFREERETVNHSDFTNLVYFCTHPGSDKKIKFRKPVGADYLGSGARQRFLLPTHVVEVEGKFEVQGEVLRRGGRAWKDFEKWQVQSALGHWGLLRNVLPPSVWENW